MTPFSSPASSYDGRTTSGCISRILRRILCFTNLPLHTFHQFNTDNKIIVESCTSTPGLVARLMGLDSLPIEETPTTSSSGLYQKSKFPAYRELQDDNFFILSFERRKSGKGVRKKQRRKERESLDGMNREENLEFEIRGGNVIKPLKSCYKKKSDKIRAKKAAVELGYEAEADSENSSPNSVLEYEGFLADQQPASSGEVSRLANSKLRRPLSDDLENCGEKKVINNAENYEETWEEMGELAAKEMMKSSWLDKENRNCSMEIGGDLELMILDQLLNEMLINLQIF